MIVHRALYPRDRWTAMCQDQGIAPFIPQRWKDCPIGAMPGIYVWPYTLTLSEAELARWTPRSQILVARRRDGKSMRLTARIQRLRARLAVR